ncbi:MAG: type I restriction-modification enzyme R subunit C-terminal domain-containing protein [Candidatus Bathyarchaeia archaeon]
MESEAETRKRRVEKALGSAGWLPIVDYVRGQSYEFGAVREYETDSGPADYVLFMDGVAVAVVESKRLELGPQNVLVQAQRYARGLRGTPFNFGGFRVPFVYSTNGEVFWFQDLRDVRSRSREVAGFHTPSGLREFLGHDLEKAEAWLRSNSVDNPYLRPYQKEAIESIEQALLSRKRRMLVAMATGTGKTVVAVSLVYRLLKSGFAKRILFLVDRRALAAQAVKAFSTFEPEPGLKFDRIYEVYSQRFRREDLDEEVRFDPNVMPNEYLTNPQPHHVFVYVCTIQRMRINLFGREGMFGFERGDVDVDEEAEKLDIPIHAFDVVIADECHRGYTSAEESKWREVLDHFDAVKIGLTATPAAHTKAYFTDIVYRYDYERAVREGYLVDYDVVKVRSDITMNGLFLKPGEEVGLKDTVTGRMTFEVLEDEREFDTTDLEAKVTAPDRNRKLVKEFAKYALKQEKELGHFPKTLFFAVNDLRHVSHADQLVDMLRDEFGRGDSFVQKITGSPTVDRPLQRIREFRNRPEPCVVVTVDMLTTGVDVPRIENLVFLRPVKSRILFEQMLGRGTRKCEEIHKTHFTVFDCFDGTLLEYFRNASDFLVEPPEKPTRSIRDVVESIYGNRDRDYNVRVLVKRLQRIDKNVSADGRELFAAFVPDVSISSFAASLPERLEKDWNGTMRILRNDGFLRLCETYPRAERVFVVATGAEDWVSSEVLFRTADGRDLKPEDYLVAFERFVKENPERIEAINILLNRPRDFRTAELRELRLKLASRPERFTEQNLRRAYHRELADIISMVRHAALNEPLLDAPERVDKALMRIREGKKFTSEQERWLELIRDHLVENLVVEEADFRLIPFSRHGGWNKANKVFDGKLKEVLEEINVRMTS